MEIEATKENGLATFCRLAAIEALYQIERGVKADARILLSRRDFAFGQRVMAVDLFGLVALGQAGAKLIFVIADAPPQMPRGIEIAH